MHYAPHHIHPPVTSGAGIIQSVYLRPRRSGFWSQEVHSVHTGSGLTIALLLVAPSLFILCTCFSSLIPDLYTPCGPGSNSLLGQLSRVACTSPSDVCTLRLNNRPRGWILSRGYIDYDDGDLKGKPEDNFRSHLPLGLPSDFLSSVLPHQPPLCPTLLPFCMNSTCSAVLRCLNLYAINVI